MLKEVSGIPVQYEGKGQAGDGDMVKRGVEASVAIDQVKIVNGKVIFGTFIFDKVTFPKDTGKVLVDMDFRGLLNDYGIDPQGFCGKLEFVEEFEGMTIFKEFQQYTRQ